MSTKYEGSLSKYTEFSLELRLDSSHPEIKLISERNSELSINLLP
jgi:hypothetical protein